MGLCSRRVLSFAFSLALAACTHQTKIQPSNAHIDNSIEASHTPQVISERSPQEAPIEKEKIKTASFSKSRGKEPTYSVVVNEVSVKDILFALARESKLNVDISPSINGLVTLNAVDQTLPAILERLSRQVSMIYRVENQVLIIEPDYPVIRNYKVNYVNMDRDTKGGVSVTNQLASTNTASKSVAGGLNNSSTAINSTSNNHFWESLIKNIDEILQETDKQVLINRMDSDVRLQAEYDTATKNPASSSSVVDASKNKIETGNQTGAQLPSLSESTDKSLKSYKTLFASKIIANKETGILSVRATQKQHEKIREFIELVESSAKRQVLIEATIVEVELKNNYQSGIDWSRLNRGNTGFVFGQTLGAKSVNFDKTTGAFTQGDANALGGTGSAGFVAAYLNPTSALGKISASITLLEQFGNTKVLSSPKMMVLNSQTAVLKVVDNLVYFVVDVVQGSTSNGVVTPAIFTTVPNTIPVGVWMSVTPQINENNVVTLNVRPTIARQSGSKRDPNPNFKEVANFIPEIQVREMESVLQIPSGSIAVLGGLMQDEIYKNTDTTPGLRDLPLIGNIFKGKNNASRKTELVIFLRPIVIQQASLDEKELETFRQYLPSQQLQKMMDELAVQ